MSSVSPPRFRTHDKVSFVGMTAIADRSSQVTPEARQISRNASQAGGSGTFVTSLEKAGVGLSDRPPSPERIQAHAGLLRVGTLEGGLRPRAGASVHHRTSSPTPQDDNNRGSPSPVTLVSPTGLHIDSTRPRTPQRNGVLQQLPSKSPQQTGSVPSPLVGPSLTQSLPSTGMNSDSVGGLPLPVDDLRDKPATGNMWSPRTALLLAAKAGSGSPNKLKSKQAKMSMKITPASGGSGQGKGLNKAPVQVTMSSTQARMRTLASIETEDGDVDDVIVGDGVDESKDDIGEEGEGRNLTSVSSMYHISPLKPQPKPTNKPFVPSFGNRHPKQPNPCMCVLLWRHWMANRKAARDKQRALLAPLNSDLFLDGPVGHVVGLCGIMPPQLRALAEQFYLELDRGSDGNITPGSFLDWMESPITKFTLSLFKLISTNLTMSGKMKNFDDFVVAVITFCLFSQHDLLRFFFNSLDTDASGSVDEKEYLRMLKMVAGQGNTIPKSYRKMLDVVDQNKDGTIQFPEFLVLAQRFPLAMFPLYKLQILLQLRTFGQDGWFRIRERVMLVLETTTMPK